MQHSDWQNKALEELLSATLKEQKAKRRWGIFFKSLFFIYLTAMVIFVMPGGFKRLPHTERHTAVVRVEGEIAAQSPANASDINAALRAAFDNPQAVAVVLALNSPGGSPVQSGEVYDEILRLRAKYPSKSVYAVVSDTCASGCYYVAAAADAIYANEASLVGSIGVLFDGFGFVDLINKIGVERRLLTAGSSKGFLDPFEPIKPQDKAFMENLLNVVHTQFIKKVKDRRGSKIKQEEEVYSGLVWTGEQGLSLGLVDGLASLEMVARDIVGESALVDYTIEPPLFRQLSVGLGASAGQAALSALEQFKARLF